MTLTPRERQPGDLTRRQCQVGRLILDGLTYAEIGQTLHLSPKTVETYVTAMRYRLGISPEDDRHRSRSRLFTALRDYFDEQRHYYTQQDAT